MNSDFPPRIMVVDDEPHITEGFKFCFETEYRVDGFTSGDEAIEAARQHSYPVAIVDLQMGGMHGISVLKQLKEISPNQQVIIHTGHSCRDTAIDALNFGAFRYLLKPVELSDFKQILMDAMARFSYESTMQRTQPIHAQDLVKAGCSAREAEIGMALMEGKTNAEISCALEISTRTVEKHVENILFRFGIHCRRQLEATLRNRGNEFFLGIITFMMQYLPPPLSSC